MSIKLICHCCMNKFELTKAIENRPENEFSLQASNYCERCWKVEKKYYSQAAQERYMREEIERQKESI